mmetsp:Transcript_43576/g.79358  ORF Transcript_43576/g.79358 Transcript_43576/m.79358 type:complete len:526 (+) Transcript_43576:131-1708(+)
MASLLGAAWLFRNGDKHDEATQATIENQQSREGPAESPTGAVPREQSLPEGPPVQRLGVFIVFVLIAQAMMSYDGGATTMSTAALLAEGWSVDMLGWLGAMDKFGQVLTALVWGALLERLHDPKWLIWFGLLAKAASCFSFAVLTAQVSMLLSKFSMGAWEALIGTWGTLWVNAHAPKDQQVAWNTFFNVMAGMGNAAGALMAGFTAERFGYGFAFKVQAGFLGLILLLMVPVDSRWLSTKQDIPSMKSLVDYYPYQPPVYLPPRQQASQTIVESLRLIRYAPWLGTAMGISLTCFVQSGANMLWQNTFMHVWYFSAEAATVSNLAVCGGGAFVGVFLGPKLFDTLRGSKESRQFRSLAWSFGLGIEAAAWSLFGGALLCVKAEMFLHHHTEVSPVIVCIIVSIFCTVDLLQSMQGVLSAINNDCLPTRLQPRGAALKLIFQNIFGYAMGMVFPSLWAAHVGVQLSEIYPDLPTEVIQAAEFCIGMASSLLMSVPLAIFLFLAWQGSRSQFVGVSDAATKPLLGS